jgi:hypothetical protein
MPKLPLSVAHSNTNAFQAHVFEEESIIFMYFKSRCMRLSDLVRLLLSGEVCEYLILLVL